MPPVWTDLAGAAALVQDGNLVALGPGVPPIPFSFRGQGQGTGLGDQTRWNI